MDTKEVIGLAGQLVNELTQGINAGQMGLKDAEQKLVEFTNWVGDLMTGEVVEGVEEPTEANRIAVDGEVAVFEQVRNLRFINRFGEEVVRPRRCYKFVAKCGGVAPLDAKLGIDSCFGFSPLMTYLICLLGCDESYEGASRKLGELLGFKISPTAVQRTTEKTGERIPQDPYRLVDAEERQRRCELMVVEVDGTTSPQIHEEPGVTGRESLKQPTEHKECNLIVIEKHERGQKLSRWTGARYGPRKHFEEYARRAGIQMGFLSAKETLFIADGASHNWELQKTHYPGAVQILDFYHAHEHLSSFCELLPPQRRAANKKKWPTKLLHGEVLQVIAEMKQSLPTVTDKHHAWGQINYLDKNKNRMEYDRYQEAGWPIGSGLVEGQCKFVIGKRFKGNGMRWKKHDNECTLRTRLAYLNDELQTYFDPHPCSLRLVA